MGDIKNVLLMSSDSIEKTSELFYQQNIQEGYNQLEQTLILLTRTIDSIFTYKAEGNELDIDTDHLLQVLSEAMSALEKKDTTLLSDILTYDLKELFEKALSTL